MSATDISSRYGCPRLALSRRPSASAGADVPFHWVYPPRQGAKLRLGTDPAHLYRQAAGCREIARYTGRRSRASNAPCPLSPSWPAGNQNIATISRSIAERGRSTGQPAGRSLMMNWTIRLREACFWLVEFAVATALIVAFAAAIKYGL